MILAMLGSAMMGVLQYRRIGGDILGGGGSMEKDVILAPHRAKRSAAVLVGLGKCAKKGHRPPTKSGRCTRCGTYIRG